MYGIKIDDMEDGAAHPYLAQVPLTVSPFVSLPTATTLPYTYKSIPTTAMPPSSMGDESTSNTAESTSKPKFIVSQSGHAAHPDDIIASCQGLTAHIQKLKNEADAAYQRWYADIQARDLAEKRRVAPGWLDRNEKILEPVRKGSEKNVMDMLDDPEQQANRDLGKMKGLVERRDEEGEAMDRAFGGLSMQ